MIQTAEGAMNEISNVLIRFRELSIQAASDTIGVQERGFIDKEMQQLKSEVERISQATEFNGLKLLNGEGDMIDIQVGQNNNPAQDRFTFDVGKTNVTAANLHVDGLSVADKESARNNLEHIDYAIQHLSENRSELGALQNRLLSTINSLQVYDENLSTARSRIYDVDMASETAELTKNNILSQTGISVLAQANQNNMLAVKLLS